VQTGVEMLDVDPVTFDRAYNGVANSTLWFVSHLLFDTASAPVFDARTTREWEAYRQYDDAFAEALARNAAPGAAVLVQDYHLALTPRQLRERRPDLRSALQPHPVGAAGVLLPVADDVARELLLGMLGRRRGRLPLAPLGRRVRALLRGRCSARAGTAGTSATRAGAPGCRCTRWAWTPRAARRGRRAGGPGPAPAAAGRRRRPAAGAPDRPHRAEQEHRAGWRPTASCCAPGPSGTSGRAPRLRLPVAARPARVPRLHRRGAAGRARGQRAVRPPGGCPCTSRSATTTRARWPRTRWPTSCSSTRCATA
jgi:hypothetical protein